MSFIYNITSKICNFSANFVKESFLYSIVLTIYLFIEDQYINSYFLKKYPKFKFLDFLTRNRFLNNHFFSPIILVVVIGIFLLLSISPLSLLLQVNIAISLVLFVLGVLIAKYLLLNNEIDLIKFKYQDISNIGFSLLLFSLFFFLLTIANVGGIPLLKPSLRYLLKPAFTMPVFLIVPAVTLISVKWIKDMNLGNISHDKVKFRIIIMTLISMSIFLLLGYRTPIVAIILMTIIIGYYSNIFKLWEILLGFFLIVGIIAGIGYMRVVNEYYLSNLGVFSTVQQRADFTLNVLDNLSFASGMTGFLHGDLVLSLIPGSELGPRMLIASIINWRSGVTITPSLFGPMLVEFGTIGAGIGMFLLGLILSTGHKIIEKTKEPLYIGLYGLIFSYILLGVETGILDQTVIIYITLTAILYFLVILKSRGLYK